ncbi:helix-turn-helix domain-containing protein [Gemmobacter serpentinus]|uniref:helix-turn-helix domain-containing protein n=1 Tax=Gemmobacter serpentinus TaxID=2652247 RepID=UPI00124C6AFE|nr:AraC family transcriptional regulator [Gemmobacter serpentinus]
MQPWFETVAIPPDRSWLLFDRQLPEFPFNWHYHPEFELTLTVNSQGMRFIGDHVARYGDGDLVLLGPNLPHAWQSERGSAEGIHRAIVCWFTRDWIEALIALLPEMHLLRPLLSEASRGLEFGPDLTARLKPRLLALGSLPPAGQVLELQAILIEMAQTAERRALSSGEIRTGEIARDRRRMERVLQWLHEHYRQPLRLAPLCDLAHLTPSQLQRIFRRSTRMTISQYVGQLRIGQACQLLAQTDHPMAHIALECGFSDAAHFARQFRQARAMTPRDYRAALRLRAKPTR